MRGVGLELWDRSSPALCSIQVQNPGASGGLTGVTTDGSLSGNGTSGSPLKVTGQPNAFFTPYAAGATGFKPAAANDILIAGFALQWPITFAHLAVYVDTADGANNSDFGIYSQAGALIANIGAAHYSSTGLVSAATLQGAQTIYPGLYLFAMTSAANTLVLACNTSALAWIVNTNVATSTGGVLNNTITAQTAAPAINAPFVGLY
jgi:hypothetical protein